MGGIATAALALAGTAAPVHAAITTDPAVTVLYVKGDAEPNQIQVDCRSGIVTVNGSPAADGHASCVDLKKLEVFGFGGDDTISLTGFAQAGGKNGFSILGALFGEAPEIAAFGGDGNDDVAGDAPFSQLSGGAGDDTVRGVSTIAPTMVGGPGNDTLTSSSFLAFMLGGKGADRIQGTAGFEIGLGGPGRDVFSGSNSFDIANGGRGRDKLAGNGGKDLLIGAAGPDAIFGGAGADVLIGNGGRDRLRGGPGDDRTFQANPSKRELKDALKAVFKGGPTPDVKSTHPRALRWLDLGR